MKPGTISMLAILSLAPPSLDAQVFDDPSNLQVLPADISAAELGETMKSFAMGTGYRCSNCHVGEEGQPLTTYDFASDEKELKQTARRMLKMVRDINATHLEFRGEGLPDVEPGNGESPDVGPAAFVIELQAPRSLHAVPDGDGWRVGDAGWARAHSRTR